MELENKMLIDAYWLNYEEDEEEWYRKADEMFEYEQERRAEDEWLAQIAEEEEEEENLSYEEWSRINDGYHF